MRVALAQIDPTVGDIDGNAAKAARVDRPRPRRGRRAGDPPRALHPRLPGRGPLPEAPLPRGQPARGRGARAPRSQGITALVGFAEPVAEPADARHAYNSIAVLADGAVQAVYRKNRLPNYAVFDEQRYFVPGDRAARRSRSAGLGVGLTICEDVWQPGPPAQAEAEAGARLIANPSGSPYHRGKGREREAMFAERSRAYGAYFAFCNLVGGQDELVFDGQSLVTAPDGSVIARAAQFEEELLVCEVPHAGPGPLAEPLADLDEVYAALALGLRDYVAKNGFKHVGLALSGGIDSALVAMLAADAVGAGAAQLRGHALPPLQLRDPAGRPRHRRQPRLRAVRDRDRADDGRLRARR